MHLVMFDIDGTLIKSCDFDAECFATAVASVTGFDLDTNWGGYTHITDAGILDEFIKRNNLDAQRAQILLSVKSEFIRLVNVHLSETPAEAVEGATEFLTQLQGREDVVIAIATGGWEETAKAKLISAGFDVSDLVLASSSDAIERAKIMKIAEMRCKVLTLKSRSYFGDGAWDKQACEKLKYNFILVGDSFYHEKQLEDFTDSTLALSHIGISS